MTWLDRLFLCLLAISPVGFIPFANWISTTRIGTSFFLWLQLGYVLSGFFAVLALPVLVVAIFFKRTRFLALFLLLLAIVHFPCIMFGIVLGLPLRDAGMKSFVQRARPLVAAIHQYERDHASPPTSLDDLVPDYLPSVPTTGMGAYPEFRYVFGTKAEEQYDGNPWVLWVATNSGGINFDMIMYFPNQNYPELGYGGWLRPIGEWAYVHE